MLQHKTRTGNVDNVARYEFFSRSLLTSMFRVNIARAGTVSAAALAAGMAFSQPALAQPSPNGFNTGTKQASAKPAPGHLLISGVTFSGNHMIPSAQLSVALPKFPAPVDLATLNEISNKVMNYYRSHDYPFAQAYFPPQRSNDGILVLKIVEGQFGKVSVDNKSALSTSLAKRIVETNLCKQGQDCVGAPITNSGLQRASLLLSDQPGVSAAGTFQRGDSFGTSNFNVVASPTQRFHFRAGVDNFGTPTTGDWRGSIGGTANELLGRGDQLNLDLVGSGEQLWNGLASYSLLLLPSGLRGGISAGRNHYELGGAYKDLDVNGYADTISAFLTYPIVRALSRNLNAGLAYQHKSLHDNIGIADYRSRHKLDNAVVSLNGNLADNLLGGGYNEFSASFVYGSVHGLDAATWASDQDPQYGLFTKGKYHKFTFSVDRQQALPGPFSLYGAVSGQVANKNLVSAEQFYVGGPAGVRAYPVGEGSADTGVLGTIELRYTVPIKPLPNTVLTLASFYDNGWVRRNQDPPPGVTKNVVDYGGAGLRAGLEMQNRFGLNLIWSHRVGGQTSQIEPGKNNFVWFQATFQY